MACGVHRMSLRHANPIAAFARFDAHHHAVSADTDREALEGHRQPDWQSLCQASVALEVHAAGDVAFEYFTYTNVANFILGTVYTANFTINQLEILPGNQMKTAREYAVSFRDLSAGSAPAVLGVELPEADGDPIPELLAGV